MSVTVAGFNLDAYVPAEAVWQRWLAGSWPAVATVSEVMEEGNRRGSDGFLVEAGVALYSVLSVLGSAVEEVRAGMGTGVEDEWREDSESDADGLGSEVEG